jgi:hypothetical protein
MQDCAWRSEHSSVPFPHHRGEAPHPSVDFPSQSSPLLVLVVGAGLAVGLLLVESVSSTPDEHVSGLLQAIPVFAVVLFSVYSGLR